MAEPVSTITAIVKFAWVGLVPWLLHMRQNSIKKENDVAERLRMIELENQKFVTQAEMKRAITEALESYKEDQQEIKILVRGLNDQIYALSKDMAVQNAIRRLNSNDNQNNGN